MHCATNITALCSGMRGIITMKGYFRSQRLYPDLDHSSQEIITFRSTFALLQRRDSLDCRRILSRKDQLTNQAIRRLHGPEKVITPCSLRWYSLWATSCIISEPLPISQTVFFRG